MAVTNYHVIEGASFARVTLISGESYDVTGLISRDIKNDVAILKVSKVSVSGNPVTAFHYLPVSSSSAVQNGDTVFTISCPLGLTNSISSGIVSNYKRTLDSTYYIQITAPISSGSSGGALLNDQGEVIGITAAAFIYGENMNLATPIDFLKNMNQAGNGVPLKDYFRPPAAKEYSLTADKTEIEVEKGDAVVVTVTTDCGEPYKLDIYNQTPGVAAALLGQTLDQYNTELYVVGIEEGVALIMVTFADGYGDPDAALKLKVVVKDPVSG